MKVELNDAEYAVFMDLLQDLSERYSNAGCNDYELEDTPENREWVSKAETVDYKDKKLHLYRGKILTQDITLLGYFIDKLEEAKGV
jgi:hypothetical protein